MNSNWWNPFGTLDSSRTVSSVWFTAPDLSDNVPCLHFIWNLSTNIGWQYWPWMSQQQKLWHNCSLQWSHNISEFRIMRKIGKKMFWKSDTSNVTIAVMVWTIWLFQIQFNSTFSIYMLLWIYTGPDCVLLLFLCGCVKACHQTVHQLARQLFKNRRQQHSLNSFPARDWRDKPILFSFGTLHITYLRIPGKEVMGSNYFAWICTLKKGSKILEMEQIFLTPPCFSENYLSRRIQVSFFISIASNGQQTLLFLLFPRADCAQMGQITFDTTLSEELLTM